MIKESLNLGYNKRGYNLLIEFNLSLIENIFKYLNIQKKTILSSTNSLTSEKNKRILEIVEKTDGDVYLSGIRGEKYLQPEIFSKKGIKVIFRNYIPFFWKGKKWVEKG